MKKAWYTDGKNINIADQHLITDEETGQNIAICYGGCEWGEAKANAHLIAAAPDLLQACKDILDCINSSNINDQINTEDAEALSEAAAEVHISICKAEGKN